MIPEIGREIARTSEWLASPAAAEMMADDPYWPKWESPWWAMLTLFELGRADAIPAAAARAFAEALNRHYERRFPASETDVAPGKNVYQHYPCFCMAGTMMRVLRAAGSDPDRECGWLRDFILRHRLADGGWNCENGKTTGSFVSTVTAAEALLDCTDREFKPAEAEAVDGAAEYLEKRSLCRSLSKNCVADPVWLTPRFPKFYDYDTLRGLTFLARWSARRGRPLGADLVRDAVLELDRFFAGDAPVNREHLKIRSLRRGPAGEWEKQPAVTTPLIDLTADPAVGRTRLLAEWSSTRPVLAARAGFAC